MLNFKKCVSFLIILALANLFFFNGIAESQDTARIIFIKGTPKIIKADKTDWTDCRVGDTIDNGDRIKTAAKEVVEISFLKNNSNILRIEENSNVFIKKGQAPYSIELLNGATMALIKSLPRNSKFEVRTPAGLCGVRGTGWRSATDGLKAVFEAFERTIYAKGIDASGNDMEGELTVRSGWRTRLDRFEKPSRLERLSNADFERWNSWKAELAERLKEGPRRNVDKTSRIAGQIEKLESKKGSVSELRDLERLERRHKTRSESSGSGGGEGGDQRYER